MIDKLKPQQVKLIGILAVILLLVVIVAVVGNKGSEATTADGQTPGMVAVQAVERAAANNEPAPEGGTTLAPETTEAEAPAPQTEEDEQADITNRRDAINKRLEERMKARDEQIAKQRAIEQAAEEAKKTAEETPAEPEDAAQ